MCARITILTLDEIRDVIADIESGRARRRLIDVRPSADGDARDAAARAEAFPGSSVYALAPDAGSPDAGSPDAGAPGLRPTLLTWGFEAPWTPSAGGRAKLVFNTRLESALGGTSMWASAFAHGRCILPAATFFEPHATETVASPRTGRQVKRAYEFAMTSGDPLLLAGIRENGRLSVVTTEPNDDVRAVHSRMPLILRFEEVPAWLEGDALDIAGLADRSAVRLSARPQPVPSLNQHDQLSLF